MNFGAVSAGQQIIAHADVLKNNLLNETIMSYRSKQNN
jgi:hypothetical protein